MVARKRGGGQATSGDGTPTEEAIEQMRTRGPLLVCAAAVSGLAALAAGTGSARGVDTRFSLGVAATAAPNHLVLHGQALAPASRVQGVKALTSRLAKTDRSLLGRSGSAPVQVVIKLDYDSVAT